MDNMDKNYNQYKQDNYYLNKNFKRYFSYIIVSLVLSSFVCLLSGCKDGVVVGSEKIENNSLSVKTYSSPFLEFNYPSNFELDPNGFKLSDMDTVVVYKGYIKEPYNDNNVVYIVVGRGNSTTIKTSIEARDMALSQLMNLISEGKCELKDKGVIKDNIATLDAVNWDTIPTRMKNYYYMNGEGRLYIATIFSYNDNWDVISQVVQGFEQSLKFK